MAEDIYTPFFKKFFQPDYLASFRDKKNIVKILYFTSPDQKPTTILLQPYPFMTLYDLKVMIYQHFRKEISAHPSFQSLLIPLPIGEVDTETIADLYMTFEYSWTKAEGTSSSDVLYLMNPFSRAKSNQVDTQFVTETGKKNLNFAVRSRMTLEDYFLDLFGKEPVVLHLFLFKDVLPGMRSELRASEREWFGRISPYYPDLNLNQTTTSISPELTTRVQIFDKYLEESLKQLNTLDTLLKEDTVPLLPMMMVGVKFLRLVWKQPEGEVPSVETLFYQLDVNHKRPFLRILPAGSSAITKLKMVGPLKIPDISDPRLLLQWKDEKNPKPDKDFLFSKVIIRETIGTQPALYGTLRVFENLSADFFVMPPKQLRLLDPRSDLERLGPLMADGLRGIPISSSLPDIGEASLVCAIRLPLQSKLMSSDTLRKRLTAFRALFQEIPPLPGDKPLLMLRYRAVSNYALEDRIYTFLTLMVTRTIAKGESAMPELVKSLQEEFRLTREEAQQKVGYWLKNRGQIEIALPETKDFIMTYNPGIDVAIFGQRSYYTIHIYRVDSKVTLERILTAVSLLLSAKENILPSVTGDSEVILNQLSDAVIATNPGAEVSNTIGNTLLEVPENTKSASVNSNSSNSDSEQGGDDIYWKLMQGKPTAGNDDQEDGEGELLNLGNALENERQNNAQINVASRVVDDNRASMVATSAILQQQQPPQPPKQENNNNNYNSSKKSYQGWVKSQLQLADERLFLYKTEIEGKKIQKYVTKCQSTESRQPFVLNQEQFDIMRETYSNDPGVVFITYPLEQNEPLPQAGDEVYTLLKYGTNPSRLNYYLCCQFFCTKDYIMVREKDFYSPTDRQGNPKPGESSPGKKDNGSCPFCHKLEIQNLKSPKPNESVIQKRGKPGSKRHLYVSFLQGETIHPEGFYMPCCFKEDEPLYISDHRFDKIRPQDQDEEEDRRSLIGVPMTSYQVTLYRAHKKYIVGPEKEYLKISEIDGPQVGLLPPTLDKYFGQDPKQYVSREANKMELLPNADCFLRVAVENRTQYRYDSFFSAIAPYLDYRNNADSVKERIKEVIKPRIFTFLNYGNMVLEFYDPGDPGPNREDLRLWVSSELQVDLNEMNEDAAMRIWKSYHHFLGFLESEKPKEYRQFAQMLALPGLLTPRGLVLIVLELNEKNELSVRCPPFGYNIQQYSSSDIGFILHRSSGIWEPIFYSTNRAQTPRFPARHQAEITFQRSLEAGWPSVVKQRVNEFSRQCIGLGRGAYTSSQKIDPMSLVPLSKAIQAMPQLPTGIVRDAYNHVVAITYRAKAGKPGLVALPVIDDEFIASTRVIHLDWDDYTPATIDLVIKFYEENFVSIFSLYPNYLPIRRVKSRATEKYVAIQLANGLFIPASPIKDESKLDATTKNMLDKYPHIYVDEMEWSLNREIYFSKDTQPSEDSLLHAKESDMNEIFEHLRLTFSNWFSGESVTKEFREQIKKIIDSRNLPLFERRKRLEILLGPTILTWMDSEGLKGEVEASLLRVDCRLRAEATCTARCVWRQHADEIGRCYLHAPANVTLGGRRVNGPKLLMMRLLEELLRFPERKQQLMTASVPTLVTLKDAIRIGDQFILPEGSVAWQDLLRLDWIESTKETKKFYEEMSRKATLQNNEGDEEILVQSEPLSNTLRSLLGEQDPKTAGLYLIKANAGVNTPPMNPYLVPLGTSAEELGMPLESDTLNRDAVKRLSLAIRRPVMYIDSIQDPIEIFSFGVLKHQTSAVPFILVITENGPRLLSSSKKYLQDVTPNQMPVKLQKIYEERIGISEQN